MLTTNTIIVTRVDPEGGPASSKKATQGYGNTIGCIRHATMSINYRDIRRKDAMPYRDLLLSKMHDKYKFPEEAKALVQSKALCTFTTTLSLWKYHANEQNGKYYKTMIKPMWPSICEDNWNEFCEYHLNDDVQNKSKWGKEIRGKMEGNHNLGSRGYPGKQPKWDKEDAKYIAKAKEARFSEIQDPDERGFVRASATFDLVTRQHFFKHDKMKTVHITLITPTRTSFYISF